MKIEAVSLFTSRKEMLWFGLLLLLIASVSLGLEYRKYRELIRFDDAEVNATVLHQYGKQKGAKRYQVLKLRLKSGAEFYMTEPMLLRNLQGYPVRVWLKTDRIGFLAYLRGFFAYGHIDGVGREEVLRYRVAEAVRSQHATAETGELFAALFTATPLRRDVRGQLSALGISHLLAISGFHMGVLTLIGFWLLRYPYGWMQSAWFPWRHGRRDLFWMTALLLSGYALFLGFVPSVLRAFAMMLVGFFLYDRGIKVLTFQTLLIALLLLLSLWPRLLFSIGFWLSAGGVFYIFLFVALFSKRGRVFQFVGMHLWVYLMMLPFALYLFHTFSLWHPLSVVWTMAFILFYPLALLLHLMGLGGLLDGTVSALLHLPVEPASVVPAWPLLPAMLLLSLLAVKSEPVKWLLGLLAAAVFVGAVYQVA